AEVVNLVADAGEQLGIAGVVDDLGDEAGDLGHLGEAEAAGGDGGGADADAAGDAGRPGVEGYGAATDRDTGLIECRFDGAAGEVERAQVRDHKVVVGAAADYADAAG